MEVSDEEQMRGWLCGATRRASRADVPGKPSGGGGHAWRGSLSQPVLGHVGWLTFSHESDAPPPALQGAL